MHETIIPGLYDSHEPENNTSFTRIKKIWIGEIFFKHASQSRDCDDFSILAACLFEYAGIKRAIGFFENTTLNAKHSMVLVQLSDLGNYGYFYYSDLTNFGLSNGKWIIIEPQIAILEQYTRNSSNKWSLVVASEIPN